MKTALITLVYLSFGLTTSAPTGTVVFFVEGIDVQKGGELSLGIFEKKDFPVVGKQITGARVKVNSGIMTVLLEEVPVGLFGAAVFQDINNDKELETNFVGLPTEPIGFSNDAKIKFGPPSFEDAKFKVEAGKEVRLKIILR